MIAQHGTAPISESALRARIRNRKIGVVRVGGRVYTNPLNLVTAGLLPVEVLSGTVGEIDDAELHAWLNPDEPASPSGGGLDFDQPSEPDDSGSPAPGPSNPEADAGPLERALPGPNEPKTTSRSTVARRRTLARGIPGCDGGRTVDIRDRPAGDARGTASWRWRVRALPLRVSLPSRSAGWPGIVPGHRKWRRSGR